jgi:competence protein ComEA
MATKGERQALLFLAAVALLGAGTRLVRARRSPGPTEGLERQIAAVERRTDRSLPGKSRRGRPRVASPESTEVAAAPPERVDLDLASAEVIERLPGIGPALAKRIVADRTANGPFGCPAALDQVKGIGPAMLQRLDTLTAFSGPPRDVCVRGGGGTPGSGPPGGAGVPRR